MNKPWGEISTSVLDHLTIPINISVSSQNYVNKTLTYQQKLFIPSNLTEQINANYSNILFVNSKSTALPAYIQSINKSGATVFVKLYGEYNQTINLLVFSKNINMLSKSGPIGEAPQLSGFGLSSLDLPHIKHIVPVVGIHGYGYTTASSTTINFSFNPSIFRNIENFNLSNMAVYSVNGTPLKASLQGTPNYSSDSATLSIVFTDGTSYFGYPNADSSVLSYTGLGNRYNFFYLGFATKEVDLNALHSFVQFSPQPSMSFLYTSHYFNNTGIYGKYDNGKDVFNSYTNYNSSNLGFANPWQAITSIPGFGLVSGSIYSPYTDVGLTPFKISTGEVGSTYGMLNGYSETGSPAEITNISGNALLGAINVSQLQNTPKGQTSSSVVGFGSDGSVNQTRGYLDSNISNKYVSETATPSISISGFNLFSLYFSHKNLVEFYLNGSSYGRVHYNSTGQTYFGVSEASTGSSIYAYYSYIRTAPIANLMPKYHMELPYYSIPHSTANDSLISTDVGLSTHFDLLTGNINSSNITVWYINGKEFLGDQVSYVFSFPGEYNVTAVKGNFEVNKLIYVFPKISVEKILIDKTNNNSMQFIPRISYGSGTYYYEWYINGIEIGKYQNMNYSFTHSGTNFIQFFVIDSNGDTAYKNLTVYINSTHKLNTHQENFPLIVYNLTAFPIGVMFIFRRKAPGILNIWHLLEKARNGVLFYKK